MIHDTWYMTHDTWCMTHDTWYTPLNNWTMLDIWWYQFNCMCVHFSVQLHRCIHLRVHLYNDLCIVTQQPAFAELLHRSQFIKKKSPRNKTGFDLKRCDWKIRIHSVDGRVIVRLCTGLEWMKTLFRRHEEIKNIRQNNMPFVFVPDACGGALCDRQGSLKRLPPDAFIMHAPSAYACICIQCRFTSRIHIARAFCDDIR